MFKFCSRKLRKLAYNRKKILKAYRKKHCNINGFGQMKKAIKRKNPHSKTVGRGFDPFCPCQTRTLQMPEITGVYKVFVLSKKLLYLRYVLPCIMFYQRISFRINNKRTAHQRRFPSTIYCYFLAIEFNRIN